VVNTGLYEDGIQVFGERYALELNWDRAMEYMEASQLSAHHRIMFLMMMFYTQCEIMEDPHTQELAFVKRRSKINDKVEWKTPCIDTSEVEICENKQYQVKSHDQQISIKSVCGKVERQFESERIRIESEVCSLVNEVLERLEREKEYVVDQRLEVDDECSQLNTFETSRVQKLELEYALRDSDHQEKSKSLKPSTEQIKERSDYDICHEKSLNSKIEAKVEAMLECGEGRKQKNGCKSKKQGNAKRARARRGAGRGRGGSEPMIFPTEREVQTSKRTRKQLEQIEREKTKFDQGLRNPRQQQQQHDPQQEVGQICEEHIDNYYGMDLTYRQRQKYKDYRRWERKINQRRDREKTKILDQIQLDRDREKTKISINESKSVQRNMFYVAPMFPHR